jgi:hypothetical protein
MVRNSFVITNQSGKLAIMKKTLLLLITFALLLSGCTNSKTESSQTITNISPLSDLLSADRAAQLSSLALHCIHREYPNKTGHVMNDETEIWSPEEMHPAFYGCFDWHSSVHGHWMLIRLLKLFPDMPNASKIREAISLNLTTKNILSELAYFQQEGRNSFERTYGWAWLLKLAEELAIWDDSEGKEWSNNLKPLTDEIVGRLMDFLPRQSYAIRTGVHPNTAFALGFGLDFAQAMDGQDAFKALLTERSLFYFASDADAPVDWEPGGEDFFSPSLMEADLMSRILDEDVYIDWLADFFPDLLDRTDAHILVPAEVADRTDPKIVHLDGLNLTRAWCMQGIANHLPDGNPYKALFINSASEHASEALKNITSGNYEGEHWLASFAVYLLSFEE